MKTKEVLYGLCTKSTPLMDVIEEAYNNCVSETSKNPTWTELTDEIADMLGICRWDAKWDELRNTIFFSNFAERNKKCNKKPFFSLDSYRIIF